MLSTDLPDRGVPEEVGPEPDSWNAETVVLKTVRLVVVRPLASSDEPLLGEAFSQLSRQSRELRFGYVNQLISKAEMQLLVHSVDGRDHVAFVAIEHEQPHRLVGVARILRYANQPDTLDVAVTVADDYQDDGLGRALVNRLAQHRPRPAARILTQVAPGNDRVMALLSVFGAASGPEASGEVEIRLGGHAASTNESTDAPTDARKRTP